MIDIDLIKRLTHYYGNLASLAQVAPKDSPAKILEQEQFKKLKDIHTQFLSISKDVGINKIMSLFDAFVKISKYLKNESFNPTIKHSLPSIEDDVYNIYEKVILEKLKDIYNQYMSMVKNIDAENIETNISLFMSLMRDFNSAVAGLNVISVNKPELKNIVAPLYKSIRDTHDRVTDMYESTGRRIEFVEYQQEEEEEDAQSDEELLSEMKELEAEYLLTSNQATDIISAESIAVLEDIYNDFKRLLAKIIKNKNKNTISYAKSIFDKISFLHNEIVGEIEKVRKPPKARKDPEMDVLLKLKEKQKIKDLHRNYKARYKRQLEIFKNMSEEEQNTFINNLYGRVKKYRASSKGKETVKKYREIEKSKRQKAKEEKETAKLLKIIENINNTKF